MSTIFKKGKMMSDRNASYLISAVNTVAMDNGNVVARGTAVAGNLDLYNVAAPTDVTTQSIYVIHSPEIVEINGYRIDVQDPSQFSNPANRPARGRLLAVGDEFVETASGFASAPVDSNKFAYPVNGALTFTAADTIPGTNVPATICEIVGKENVSTGMTTVTGWRLRVIKAIA